MVDLLAVSDPFDDGALPPSGLDRFDQLLDQLCAALDELFDLSGTHYNDINRNSDFVVLGWNPRRWNPLPPEAAPKVGVAREAFRKLKELAAAAARDAPDRTKELEGLEADLDVLIEQPDTSTGAPKADLEKIRSYAKERIKAYREVIRQLPTAHGSGEKLLVADTSALLDYPNLQEWRLDGSPWTLILLPQVLSELDEKKRDSRTRDAAQRVINQVEDFDRRGDTFLGVPLAGNLSVREVPISPNMDETLPWLRAEVPDDMIIAGALELALRDLTSRIVVTASDRNVRNKARLAGLGIIRPSAL